MKIGNIQVYKLIFVQLCVNGLGLSCISKENIPHSWQQRGHSGSCLKSQFEPQMLGKVLKKNLFCPNSILVMNKRKILKQDKRHMLSEYTQVTLDKRTDSTPWKEGLHQLWYPTIRDTSTWSKFGAHGEHGVEMFSCSPT